MTLEQLSATLPWGFHDAELVALHVNFAAMTAELELLLPINERQTTVRPARVHLTGLQYLINDQPDPTYPFARAGALWLDDGPGVPPGEPDGPPIAEGAFRHWFFVDSWNGFIRVSACDARLEWCGGAQLRSSGD